MNNKYKIFKLLCVLASIILIGCLLLTKIPTMQLIPFALLNLAVYDILKNKENKEKNNYKKFDVIKIIIVSIMLFWCVIIVIGVVNSLVRLP
ncbi:dipeptide/tripeptide permease [Clostridium punense]|uniref:Dipeptide/tripeptide permease n=1 Tax=Clostridium punense TaxID=1054297 RepID=A0ABS4K9Z8_9CLOT|nr:hypothetical protein M918_07860 [Clostridium sp. BL8]MBP2024180.1 dipeptide/tripeptide permease [Clostridium punense]